MKKTPDEWLQTEEFKNIKILDPDGWNRQAKDWDKEWNTALTKEEFTNKMMTSTIMTIKPKNEIGWMGTSGTEMEDHDY